MGLFDRDKSGKLKPLPRPTPSAKFTLSRTERVKGANPKKGALALRPRRRKKVVDVSRP